MPESTVAVERVVSRADLLAVGFTPKGITRAVRSGVLIRLRRDHYVRSTSPAADLAVRIGGRLTCVSALATAGVFTLEDARVHVHVERRMSRVRGPRHRRERWNRRRHGAIARVHWGELTVPATCDAVGLVDAIHTLVRCRPPREVVAALDSVLHLGLMSETGLRAVFDSLPAKYGVLLRLVDARAESGTETFVRLMLRRLGVDFDVQVDIPGVGRVDFVVAGRLIIECDSKAHHSDWSQRRRDIRRDQQAARMGYATVRLLAEDIIFQHDAVQMLLADLARSDLLR